METEKVGVELVANTNGFKNSIDKVQVQIDKLKMKTLQLKSALNDAKWAMNNATTGGEWKAHAGDVIRYENALKEAKEQLNSLERNTKSLSNSSKLSFNSIGQSITSAAKKTSRLILGIFGIRSAYMAVRSAINILSAENEQLCNDISNIKSALANALLPVIETIVGWVKVAMGYINQIWTHLFGKDLFKASAKSAKTTEKALKNATTSIDELNILNKDENSSGGTSNIGDDFKVDDMGQKAMTWVDVLIASVTIAIATFAGLITGAIGLIIGLFQGVYEALTGFWNGVIDIGYGVVMGIYQIVEGVINGFKTFFSEALAGIFIIIEGFKDGDWNKVWQGVKKVALSPLKGLITAIKGIVSGILTFLYNLGVGVTNIIIGVVNGVIKIINGVIAGLNLIKIPDWVPLIGGAGINIKQISTISYIPRGTIQLATGGIVNDSIMANIGEKGKEAVVPLTNSNAMKELGNIIGQYIGQDKTEQPINVTSQLILDSRTLARAVSKANYQSGMKLVGGAFAL